MANEDLPMDAVRAAAGPVLLSVSPYRSLDRLLAGLAVLLSLAELLLIGASLFFKSEGVDGLPLVPLVAIPGALVAYALIYRQHRTLRRRIARLDAICENGLLLFVGGVVSFRPWSAINRLTIDRISGGRSSKRVFTIHAEEPIYLVPVWAGRRKAQDALDRIVGRTGLAVEETGEAVILGRSPV
jgi:hypothetical protein